MWYAVDRDDVILDASSKWEECNLGSGQGPSPRDEVIGTVLWRHVVGNPARQFLQTLFNHCRMTGRYIEIPYRCDFDHVSRLFLMQVEPAADGTLHIAHQPVRQAYGPAVIDLHDLDGVMQCPHCLRCKMDEFWREVHVAVPTDLFPVRRVVCPSCTWEIGREGAVLGFRRA